MKKLQTSTMIIIIFLLLSSCSQNNDFQKIDFREFSISLPSTWKKINVQGLDSKVYIIITPSKDSIYFDLGKYTQKFDETNRVFSKEQIRKYDLLKMDTKELHSSDTPEIDQAQGVFLKEYYYYETINKKVGKVKIPKKPGIGETGIYFKDVNKSQLTIIGKNLSKNEQDILVNSFNTIEFKN